MDIVQEDIPPGTSLLIVGPPGSGKTILSQQIMYHALKGNKSTICIASKSQINLITSRKNLFNWDVASYLDNNQLNVMEIGNVTDPTELNISLAQVIGKSKQPLSLIVVDSLTVLMVGIDQGKIMKFAEGLAGKLQAQNVSLILLATPTSETQDFLTKMKSLTSSVIEIKLEEGGVLQRYMRIFKFQNRNHSTRWYPFEITDNGIQFAASSVKIPDTFLFDLDGTLVAQDLDLELIQQQVDTMVIRGGCPEECLDKNASVLETIQQAVSYMQEHGMEWEGVKKEALSYLEQKELEAVPGAVCIEGAKNVLKILKEKKMKVGIITKNNRKAALQLLEKCGLHSYADVFLTRDDVEDGEPYSALVLQAVKELDSLPERTVVLSDYHGEIEAGNNARCFTVGVLSGSGTRVTLGNADLVLNSIRDLGKILTIVK
jgi:HAD superfamily hydrolase (TIGR01509 family)